MSVKTEYATQLDNIGKDIAIADLHVKACRVEEWKGEHDVDGRRYKYNCSQYRSPFISSLVIMVMLWTVVTIRIIFVVG